MSRVPEPGLPVLSVRRLLPGGAVWPLLICVVFR